MKLKKNDELETNVWRGQKNILCYEVEQWPSAP